MEMIVLLWFVVVLGVFTVGVVGALKGRKVPYEHAQRDNVDIKDELQKQSEVLVRDRLDSFVRPQHYKGEERKWH
jgi:hypothetical protein